MKAAKIWFNEEFIFVETTAKEVGKMPLRWFPSLLNANNAQRYAYELWNNGEWIHWEEIGEDLGVEGFFTFNKDELIKHFI